MKISISTLVTILLFTGSLQAQTGSPAQAIFVIYQSLERSFNPDVADLYCDTAVIRNVRTYPAGNNARSSCPRPSTKPLFVQQCLWPKQKVTTALTPK